MVSARDQRDHPSSEVGRALVRRPGGVRAETLRYLPRNSPDFIPIENAFAKLEALLRKAAERTVGALCDRIGIRLDAFTPAECANYFAAAGYDAA